MSTRPRSIPGVRRTMSSKSSLDTARLRWRRTRGIERSAHDEADAVGDHRRIHEREALIRLAGAGPQRLTDDLDALRDARGVDAGPRVEQLHTGRRAGGAVRQPHAQAQPRDEPGADVLVVEHGREVADPLLPRLEVLPDVEGIHVGELELDDRDVVRPPRGGVELA